MPELKPSATTLLVALPLLCSAPLLGQAPLLKESRSNHLPRESWELFPADLNNDRAPDLIASTAAGQQAWLNLGSHRFVDITSQAFPVNVSGIQAPLDADGDGDTDLLMVNGLLRNRGQGIFVAEALPSLMFSVAVGDIDGDGDVDVVGTRGPGPRQTVLLNDGLGRFQAVDLVLPTNDVRQEVLLADLDGDGDLDLCVIESRLAVLRNDGAGNFSLVAQGFLPSNLSRVRAVDIDRDGDLDLVSANRVLANLGQLTFSDETFSRIPVPLLTVFAGVIDADRDGDLDLVASDANGFDLLSNNGSGVFVSSGNPILGGRPEGVGMLAVDLDGDGLQDLISLSGELLAGRGNGQFALLNPADIGRNRQVVGVADLDGDGDPDLLERESRIQHSYRTLRNDGGASFVPLPATAMFSSVPPVLTETLGDLDGDGDLDVLGSYGASLHRLVSLPNLGNGTFAAPVLAPFTIDGLPVDVHLEDLDRDGDLDAIDVGSNAVVVAANIGGQFLAGSTAWTGTTLASACADFDGDGDRDLLLANDALTLLENRAGAFVDVTAQQFVTAPRGFGRPSIVRADGKTWLLWSRNGAVDVYERTSSGFLAQPSLGVTFPGTVGSARVVATDAPGVELAVVRTVSGASTTSLFSFDGRSALRDVTHLLGGQNYTEVISTGDLDVDGDLDLLGDASFRDFRVLRGQARALRVPYAPRVGTSLDLVVRDAAATSTAYVAAVGLLGVVGRQQLPGIGVLRLQPTTIVALPPRALISADEQAISLPIPNDRALRDVEIGAQFAHVQPSAAVTLGPLVRAAIR